MAKIKVTLEFNYEVGEDISDWFLEETDLKSVNTADEAIEVARAELVTHSPNDFIFKVYDDKGDYLTKG